MIGIAYISFAISILQYIETDLKYVKIRHYIKYHFKVININLIFNIFSQFLILALFNFSRKWTTIINFFTTNMVNLSYSFIIKFSFVEKNYNHIHYNRSLFFKIK